MKPPTVHGWRLLAAMWLGLWLCGCSYVPRGLVDPERESETRVAIAEGGIRRA